MKRLGILIAVVTSCAVEEPDWRTMHVERVVTPAEAAEPRETAKPDAYSRPAIERSEVIRRGRKVTLRLSWLPVEGEGVRYRVEVARTLTFARMVAGGETAKTRLAARRLAPMVYFWRVRALGERGEGPWSAVQVVDATIVGQRGRRPPPTAAAETKDRRVEEPELVVVWHKPRHRLVTTRSPVLVEGVATRGAQIQVGSQAAIEVASTFSVPVFLTHGRNQIRLTGKLGNQEKSLQRVVYYADPGRLAPIRLRFEKLQTQLEEIAALRAEVAKTADTLEARLDKAEDESLIAEIKSELRRVSEIRREIDREINTALSDLDQLLAE